MPKLRRIDRPRHPASAKNAKPKRLFVGAGGVSILSEKYMPDERSSLSRFKKKTLNALLRGLGRPPSAVDRIGAGLVAKVDAVAESIFAAYANSGTLRPTWVEMLVKCSRELQAWFESDVFSSVVSPDLNVTRQIQAEELRKLSTEALAAIKDKYYPTAPEPAPLLLLPAPKPRIRLRPIKTPPSPIQAEPCRVPEPAPPPPPPPAVPDPFSREEQAKRAAAAASDELTRSTVDRGDAPWNL